VFVVAVTARRFLLSPMILVPITARRLDLSPVFLVAVTAKIFLSRCACCSCYCTRFF
jgi:hypothetical protein